MEHENYETVKKRVSENLDARKKELARSVGDISRNFRDLGLETAVWFPERIHSANIGGLDADSYIGYSRVEGKWGLIIRTIERDHDSHAFVSQRVYPIESCANVGIVVSALKKARDLLLQIAKTTDQEIDILTNLDLELDHMRDPGFGF